MCLHTKSPNTGAPEKEVGRTPYKHGLGAALWVRRWEWWGRHMQGAEELCPRVGAVVTALTEHTLGAFKEYH